MPYDSCPRTIRWFESALSAECPRTRWRAVELLRYVNGPRRRGWLETARRDADARVSATAILTLAAVEESPGEDGEDLLESDFALADHAADLEWEWEYSFVVCYGLYVPSGRWLVWLREEDDEEARRLALLKANVGEPEPGERTAIITSKRYVNRYTRSPRSFAEAMKWHDRGRPRYPGDENS